MEVGRVLVTGEHCGDATLGPTRGRLLELALGENTDTGPSELSEADRRGEPGDAAADDEDVETLELCHAAAAVSRHL
jgi:hypothetical protein